MIADVKLTESYDVFNAEVSVPTLRNKTDATYRYFQLNLFPSPNHRTANTCWAIYSRKTPCPIVERRPVLKERPIVQWSPIVKGSSSLDRRPFHEGRPLFKQVVDKHLLMLNGLVCRSDDWNTDRPKDETRGYDGPAGMEPDGLIESNWEEVSEDFELFIWWFYFWIYIWWKSDLNHFSILSFWRKKNCVKHRVIKLT